MATVSGEAVVSGLRNVVKVNSVSGSLIVSDVEGAVDMYTVSGTVDGDSLTGRASVNSVSGVGHAAAQQRFPTSRSTRSAATSPST